MQNINELTIELHGQERRELSLHLRGKLTITTIDALQRACLKALRETSATELVLDMQGIDYVDSLSMGRLVAINKAAREQQHKLVLINLQDVIRKAFRTLHVDRIIEVR
jgi:anti-anti-sigma factor